MNTLLALTVFLAAPQELDEAQRRELEALVTAHAAPKAPGGILGVLWSGEPCFVRPFGLADVERGVAVDEHTVFYLASVAKTFTAECVLAAQEEHKLALEDALGKHVPALPADFARVTLAQLLRHTSGIPDLYDLAIGLDLGPECLASNAAALGVLTRLGQLDFEPDARCVYSNSGYLFLAEAVRRATGQSFPAYARQHLFEPLGMASTRFTDEPELAGLPLARSYHEDEGRWTPLEIPTRLVGPGGLWSSLADLVRHERATLQGDSVARRAHARFLDSHAKAAGRHPVLGGYDLGRMASTELGLACVRSAGEAFGFQSEILRFPDFELTVIVLANADRGTDELCEQAAEVLLRDEVRPVPASSRAPSPDLARFGRFWREEGTGLPWILDLRPDSARVIALGDWRAELEPAGPSRLLGKDTPFSIELAFAPEKGPAERLTVTLDGRELAHCLPHVPSAQEDLADLAGTYEHRATGATLEFRTVEGGLELVQRRPLGPTYRLSPFRALGGDWFLCNDGATLQFERDSAGKVLGARYDVNRARGLALTRR